MKKYAKPQVNGERTLSQTIERAVLRACRSLAMGPLSPDGKPTIDAGWEAEPIAPWITPTVVRAVQRYVHEVYKK